MDQGPGSASDLDCVQAPRVLRGDGSGVRDLKPLVVRPGPGS